MFGSTSAMSNDLNFPFPASAPSSRRGKDDAAKVHHHQQHSRHPQQHQSAEQQQMTSGLLRYRSAPGNLLGEVCEEFLPQRAGSPEGGEPMFARFMVPELRDHFGSEKPGESSGAAAGDQHPAAAATPPGSHHHGGTGFPSFTQLLFQSTSQPHHHPNQPPPPLTAGMNAAAAPYRVVTAELDLAKAGGGDESSLIRQSSSPAFFSHLSAENAFNPNRVKSQISFSSRHGSDASRLMPQISESPSENLGSGGSGGSPEESRNGRCFIPGYPVASWEDSVLINDNFPAAVGAKRCRVDPAENGEASSHSGGNLVHHLNFPKSSAETEYLQFQDGVPWKLRAKRGCATHPRSIAERVRRTKISERMRKLQELVPNMEKQTNTADMLELAVDYIKNLKEQVKALNERRADCTCSGK